MSVELLFNHILKKSIELRQIPNTNANGLAFWHKMKGLLKAHNSTILVKWKKTRQPNKKSAEAMDIMDLPEFLVNGNGTQQTIEENHFLIQSIRLPTEGNNIRKLMQIALNIGQYVGMGGTPRPWMRLNNYLSQKEIKRLDKKHKVALTNLFKQIVKALK
jgi:hypothetical protein